LSDEDLKILENTYAVKVLSKAQKLLALSYSQLKANLPDMGSFEDYKLAYNQATSRHLSMTIFNFKFFTMVPFGDMFNTRQDPNVSYTYSQEAAAFIFKANRKIDIGEELYINYGNHDKLHFFI